MNAMSKKEEDACVEESLLLAEARDLKEAIQVAAKMPVARGGSIEVRPIKELRP